MGENFTADPRFQIWCEASRKVFSEVLADALRDTAEQMEERAIVVGAAYALAEQIFAHEKGAKTHADRAEKSLEVWTTLGASVFLQLAAGHTDRRQG